MDYPILDVPVIGGSLLIAGVAIVHVVIAHFAVGAGIFNAFHEWRANRSGDEVMLRFLRTHSKFIILFPFIAGAVTGVGIWFAIALVSPRATSNLIHLFVWAWATEYSFFITEIAAGYIYYYTWGKLSPRLHNAVGWVYAVSALASLVLINGIVAFMLTPGQFTGAESFWQNLFNPSFWPSTPVRAISGLALAAIFVIIVANYSRKFTDDERHHVVRKAGWWLVPLALMVPLAWWYFESIPPQARNFIFSQAAMVMVLLFTFGVAASVLIALYSWFGIVRSKRFVSGETGLLLLAIAFIATGSMEFVREGIRKPYVIRPSQLASGPQGLYSTGLTPEEMRLAERVGVLALDPWNRHLLNAPPAERGKAIFSRMCSACHTADGGYNPVKPLVTGWTASQYASNLSNLHATKEAMPHYEPTQRDLIALTAYLRTLDRTDKTDEKFLEQVRQRLLLLRKGQFEIPSPAGGE